VTTMQDDPVASHSALVIEATADFDAAWPLWGVLVPVSPAIVPEVTHRRRTGDPTGPVEEGRRFRVGACGSTLTLWTDKTSGEGVGITCPDCGSGQVCGVGHDDPATRLTAHGLRCAAHR